MLQISECYPACSGVGFSASKSVSQTSMSSSREQLPEPAVSRAMRGACGRDLVDAGATLRYKYLNFPRSITLPMKQLLFNYDVTKNAQLELDDHWCSQLCLPK
jgi:hypothetical protein